MSSGTYLVMRPKKSQNFGLRHDPRVTSKRIAAMHMKRSQHAALDSGDTAFVMVCSVLVLLMTLPGLMLFYGAFCARGAIPRQFSFARICVRQRHRRWRGIHHLAARVRALGATDGRERRRVRAFLRYRRSADDVGPSLVFFCFCAVADHLRAGRSA